MIKFPNRGFSLLEVIIAMAILIVGLVGVMHFFPVGLRASEKASLLSEVSFLAEKKLEELKAYSFDSIASLPPQIPLEGKEGDYKWSFLIEEVQPQGVEVPNDIRMVTLKVEWTEGMTPRNKRFVTYVTRK